MIEATTVGIVMIPLMFAFLFLGMPIVFGIALASVVCLALWGGVPMQLVFQQFFQGINSFTLLALPMFMLAGELMMRIGIVDDICAFSDVLLGKLRGGLGYVNVLAKVFFAAISGSAVADMAAIGTLLVPKMEEQGYRKDFSLALTAAASVIGPIIPPSILMVVYSSMMGVSTGAMFIGGLVPGIILGLALMVYVWYVAKKEQLPVSPNKYTVKSGLKVTLRTIPVIIMGGIFSGMFSPTEAAAISCVYAILLGIFYYHKMSFAILKECFGNAMLSAGGVLLIVAIAKPFSWLLAMSGFPAVMADWVNAFSSNKYVILLLINIVGLILGCLMESTANVMIFAPILAPIAIAAGVDPLHFGVIFVLNLTMGVATPPFGICLFMGSSMGNIPVARLMKAVLPMIAMEIAVLLFCTYVPATVTLVPTIAGLL